MNFLLLKKYFRILKTVFGVFLIILGISVIIGWHTNNPTLIQILPTLTPMQYNSAICFVLSGIALILLVFKKYYGVILLSLPLILVGFLTILEYSFNINLGIDQLLMRAYITVKTSQPGRMGLNTAVCFLSSGISLIALVSFRNNRWSLFIAGLLGLVVMVIVIVTVTGYLIGFNGTFAWGQLTSMAIHTAIAFIFLSLGITLSVWIEAKESENPVTRWLPVYAGVAVAVAAIIFWQALISQQREKVDFENKIAAESIKLEIKSQVEDRFNAMIRMAKRWENKVYPTQQSWQDDAALYVTHYPDYQALEWIDASYQVRWAEPETAKNFADSFNEAAIANRQQAMDTARQTNQPILTRLLDITPDEKGILVIIPLSKDSKFDGFILGAFRINVLLNNILSSEKIRDYKLTIRTGNEEIYNQNTKPDQIQSYTNIEKLNFFDEEWELIVQPTGLNPLNNTILPQVSLILGLSLAGLMGLAAHFGIKSNRNADESINAYTKLIDEISERARIQDSLEEMTVLQKAILDSANYSIISTDVNGTILTFNCGAERMLGYSADEIINLVTPAILHDVEEIVARAEVLSKELRENIEPGFEVFVRKTRDRLTDENEWTYIRKDGTTFPVRLSVTALRDADGQITGFLGIGKDISKQKRDEVLFQKEKQLLEMIARNKPMSAILGELIKIFDNYDKNISSSVMAVTNGGQNLRFASTYNLPKEFISAWENIEIGPNSASSGTAAFLKQPVIVSDIEKDLRWENYRKTARECNIRTGWSFPVISTRGNVLAVFSIYKPIVSEPTEFEMRLIDRFTYLIGIAIEKHLFEKAMKESEATIRSFYDSAGMMMGVVEVIGDDVIYISANPATCRSVGLEESQLKNQFARPMGVPDDQMRLWLANYQRTLETGLPVSFEFENRILDKTKWMQATVGFIGYANSKNARFSYVVQDITDKKNDEQHIKQSLLEKESLLKEIHHRVKNNMQVISSLLSLQSNYITDPHALEVFGESQQRVQSMALIHEKLYRSDDLAHIDFSEYIQDLTSSLFSSYMISTDSIKLEFAVESVFLSIHRAIPCGLIINELVSNSLKHAFPDPQKQGEIKISFQLDEDKLHTLSIKDNGIGLPNGFDIENAESMGLRLVSILSNQLNATLEITNGMGTEYKLRFPEKEI
jgi:PAS domain S-box-containing protein